MNQKRKLKKSHHLLLYLLFNLLIFSNLQAQCEIGEIIIETTPCNDLNQFSVIIDFDYANTSDLFTISGNGNDYGTFAYSELPITLGPFAGNNNMIYEFVITDSNNPNCSNWGVIGPIHCNNDCGIENITYEVDCFNQEQFNITINFNWEFTSDSFYIVGNGNNYGNFHYDQVPITLGPLPGDGSLAYEFGIFDLIFNDCGGWIEPGAIDCNPNTNCEIGNLLVEPYECDDQGMFLVDLTFNYANTSDSFTVVGNGNNYGTFAYSDLFITLGPFEGNGSVYEFVVFDQNHPDCGANAILQSEDCLNTDCLISEVVIEVGDCNDDGTYPIWIDFEVQNPGNDFFEIYDANGNYIGFFPLNDLPLMLTWGPSYTLEETIVICINDNPDCCVTHTFEAPNCNTTTCEIWDLIVEPYECDDLGMFLIDLTFNYANTSDSFTVVGNGNNYGTFAYSDLFITLGPFEGNGSVYEFVVFDQNHPDCGAEAILQSEDCFNTDCLISEVVIEVGDCNDDGTYPIWIDFEVQNPGNDFFEIYDANGNYIGFFPLNELPLMLTWGPSNTLEEAIVICINDNPDCCVTHTFEAPNCNTTICEIWDLIVEPYECDDQGMFLIDLTFNYANTSDSFTVVGNGNNYGTFAYSDLFITLGPFEGNGSVYEFVVFDQNHPDCAAEAILQSEDCLNTDCLISEVVIEVGDCNDDGTYPIWIDFEVQNPGNDFFEIYDANGNYIGFFPLNDLPLMLTWGPSNTLEEAIVICINDNPNCCVTHTFEAPNCNTTTCEIWDLIVEPYECDDQGMFLIDLTFNYANTSDSFTVVGNGNNYGTFAYSDLFITLGPFEGNGSVYEFVVFDQNHPDCGAEAILQSEDCLNNDCDISNLFAFPLDCNPDGTYSLLILFDYENVQSDFFDVYANGSYLATYLYDDLPLSIPSFPGSGNDVDALTICDSDSDLCCESTEFEALDCMACEIWDVVATPGPCNDLDEFEVSLDFNHSGTGSLGFMVFGNGNAYGIFDYADLPITLGPFLGDGTTVYEFIVVDVVDVDCIGFTELDPVTCDIPPPVWPGDINNDNISNNYDLLNLGVAFGETGPARTQNSIDWMSWEGPEWSLWFIDGVNMKHADCNGDGVVNNNDLTAIDLNYRETHGDVIPPEPIPVSPDDPPLYIDLPTADEVTIGQAFVAPIILGTEETPVESIYGIAFTVEYDPEMMDEAGVYIETGSSWLGEQGNQLININKNFADEGIIEVAITRTDHNNIDGFGTISYFIGIIDDIAGKNELEIKITNVRAITYEELLVPIYGELNLIDFTSNTAELADIDVTIFPNPVAETLHVVVDNAANLQSIAVYNILGQQVVFAKQPERKHQIDVSSWAPGTYHVNLQFETGRVSEKIVVIK